MWVFSFLFLTYCVIALKTVSPDIDNGDEDSIWAHIYARKEKPTTKNEQKI